MGRENIFSSPFVRLQKRVEKFQGDFSPLLAISPITGQSTESVVGPPFIFGLRTW
jgi:hypothetical protein